MKYTGGKSWFNKSTQEWEYMPRAYTDFYCSIKEWHNLGRGRLNFIAQAISCALDEPVDNLEMYFSNSKDRAKIISHIIFLITHRRPKVTDYWEDEIKDKDYIIEKSDHIEIEFPGLKVPNIIILYDIFEPNRSNGFYDTVIDCVDCLYKILELKTLDYYDNYLYQFFNNDYDYVFFKGDKESHYYDNWNGKWSWKDVIKRKDERIYDEYETLLYKFDKIKLF